MCEKEKLFLELIEGFTWKYDNDEYSNYLFGFKDSVCLFDIYCFDGFNNFNKKNIIVKYRLKLTQSLNDAFFYINDEIIWKAFENKFNISYHETQSFMNMSVKKHFKFTDVSCFRAQPDIYEHVESYFNTI